MAARNGLVSLDTVVGEVRERVRLASSYQGGALHRRDLPDGPEYDAALTVLQSRGEIEAWQRVDSWAYTPVVRPTDPWVQMLRDSNPHIVEQAAENPAVEAAAREWVRRHWNLFTPEGRASDSIAVRYEGGAVVRYDDERQGLPHLEVDFYHDGSVRLRER